MLVFGASPRRPTHPPTRPHQRGRKFEADFRYTNFFLAPDPKWGFSSRHGLIAGLLAGEVMVLHGVGVDATRGDQPVAHDRALALHHHRPALPQVVLHRGLAVHQHVRRVLRQLNAVAARQRLHPRADVDRVPEQREARLGPAHDAGRAGALVHPRPDLEAAAVGPVRVDGHFVGHLDGVDAPATDLSGAWGTGVGMGLRGWGGGGVWHKALAVGSVSLWRRLLASRL